MKNYISYFLNSKLCFSPLFPFTMSSKCGMILTFDGCDDDVKRETGRKHTKYFLDENYNVEKKVEMLIANPNARPQLKK